MEQKEITKVEPILVKSLKQKMTNAIRATLFNSIMADSFYEGQKKEILRQETEYFTTIIKGMIDTQYPDFQETAEKHPEWFTRIRYANVNSAPASVILCGHDEDRMSFCVRINELVAPYLYTARDNTQITEPSPYAVKARAHVRDKKSFTETITQIVNSCFTVGDLISAYPQLKRYFAVVSENSSDLAITQERLTNIMRSAGISNVSNAKAAVISE